MLTINECGDSEAAAQNNGLKCARGGRFFEK
jgi:hypothetical protein